MRGLGRSIIAAQPHPATNHCRKICGGVCVWVCVCECVCAYVCVCVCTVIVLATRQMFHFYVARACVCVYESFFQCTPTQHVCVCLCRSTLMSVFVGYARPRTLDL